MVRARWFCFWFSIILRTCGGLFLRESNPPSSVSTTGLIPCVERIASEYFTRKENVLIISDRSFITGEILRRIEPRFGINLANNKSGIDFRAVWDYLVLDDKGTDPYGVVENMTVNPRGRYVIVTKGDPETLETAAARFWRAGIPDAIFLQKSNDSEVKVFGYEIGAEYQNSTRLRVLDIWKGGFENGVNLFASKFRDMKQYPLRVTVLNTHQMKPDIYITREDGEIKIYGVGSTLVKIFAEKLNFRIVVTENSYYGHKEKDGTWTGPPGQLIRGEADLSFTGILPSVKVTRDLEYSDFFRWDSLHFTMRVKGKIISWQSFFKPLSLHVWLAKGVVLFTTLSLVWIVKKFSSMNMLQEYIRHMDVLRVVLNQNVRYPKLAGFRLAFALWLIYGYLMNASYTGGLVRYLSMPNYEKDPNTFEELEKSKIEIGGPISMKVLLGETGDPVERKIHDRFVNLTYTNFWKVLSEKERAVVLYRSTSIIHNWRYRSNESMWLHNVEDPIISIPLFYFMKKGHPYREPLNHIIRHVHSSGLIEKWMFDYDARKAERIIEQESVVLTLEHLAGVFLLLLSGYVLSIVRFLYELYHR